MTKPRDIVFEELDYQQTELGELILRRRSVLQMPGTVVHEVKLDGSFLMSSLVNASEVALAELGLSELGNGPLEVVVGGLGLGYTAKAALDHAGVESLIVIEFLQPVISWHERGLVPLGETLQQDPRCRLVHDDFFVRALDGTGGFDPDDRERRFDAILLDIDHTPTSLLHERHRRCYSAKGLARLASHLKPGGAFALWSSEAPEALFLDEMSKVFCDVVGHRVEFENPLLNMQDVNAVYVGRVQE